ncbi:MAG TPA: acyl-CoA dehydrogenase family protein [Candidatus Bathyarchaeia archaeon]|nr:acyl-CoA dehydrogenase family protein [Candidatus Bathyarchaeia archaeon]
MSKEFFHRDMQLFIDHRYDWKRYFELRGFAGDAAQEVETYKAILATTGEVCEDLEAGASGHWHEEVRLEDGRVVVPPHIAAGYEKLRSAGLLCLTLSPDYGGYGLPALVNFGFLEMVARADASLMTIIGLQAGVALDIEKYGSDELRRRYLPGFATGELQGCMDLTEPQAGSDLGGIVTRVTQESGRSFIDGEKIFITNGGAQVHLVLAREAASFEQSKGTTNGLSLMLCPVVLADGTKNRVRVARVERKMGIHGSPTCVIEFDHAEAFLLGKSGTGFRAMLDLMNNARLGVAAQALGVAEGAYRAARDYAGQRVQFGAPIAEQPLVKSMLTLIAINIQAARALLYRTCALIDSTEALRRCLATEHAGEERKRVALQEELERNQQLIRFFTPLCKYYATEISNHVTRQGIQIHGGIGYMSESVAGHYHSDSIITTIYEGTSEIQASFALKEMGKGALFATLESTRTELESLGDHHAELIKQVCEGIRFINESATALMTDPQYALLNAKRLCEMVIDVVVGAELLFQADISPGKLELAASFIHRHMPAVEMNARRISSGDATRIKRYDRILGL